VCLCVRTHITNEIFLLWKIPSQKNPKWSQKVNNDIQDWQSDLFFKIYDYICKY